jgi:hypothetical protein
VLTLKAILLFDYRFLVMKKTVFLLLAVCWVSTANSQVLIALIFGDKLNSPNVEFGLEVGPSYSWFGSYEGSSISSSLFIGPTFNIRLNDRLWLHPAVQVTSSIGAASLAPYELGNENFDPFINEFEVERRINYIAVPLMARYKVIQHFFLQGGVEPALRTAAYDTFTADIEDGAEIKNGIEDTYNRIDLRVVGGIAYRFKNSGAGLWMSLKYGYGLFDLPDPVTNQTVNPQFVQLTFEIPIGAAEKVENTKN